MGSPQNRRFYGKMECLPLWFTYIGEKGRTLGKTYGIKARCYWKHREHIVNLIGTHWELEGNILGTKGKIKKILSPPPPNLKLLGKKIKSLWVHAEASHWLQGISMFQNCSSTFLAPANTPIINGGYLFAQSIRMNIYTHVGDGAIAFPWYCATKVWAITAHVSSLFSYSH